MLGKPFPKSFKKMSNITQKDILNGLIIQVEYIENTNEFNLINHQKSIITSNLISYLQWETHRIGIKLIDDFIISIANGSLYCGNQENPYLILVIAKLDDNYSFITKIETKVILPEAFINVDRTIKCLVINDSVDCRIDFIKLLKVDQLILLTNKDCFNDAYLNSLICDMIIAPKININNIKTKRKIVAFINGYFEMMNVNYNMLKEIDESYQSFIRKNVKKILYGTD